MNRQPLHVCVVRELGKLDFCGEEVVLSDGFKNRMAQLFHWHVYYI